MNENRIQLSHPDSYYAATAHALPFPRLSEAVTCDVCVIGGGFTGLSSALHLAERGFSVVLLEAQRVGWGASGRNGGQLGSGQRPDKITLEASLGKDHARRLWALAEESKALVKELIRRHRIDCDLKPGVLHAGHKPALADWYLRYAEKLRDDYHYAHVQPVSRETMAQMLGTRAYYGGYLDQDAAHLHPLNYVLGLARAAQRAGVSIFEGSPATGYRGTDPIVISTPRGAVRGRFLVLGCNGYLGNLEPRITGKIMPINNFILATEPLGEARARVLIRDDVAVADSKFVINYYRLSTDKRLLFGGGENYTRRFPKELKRFVRPYMLKIYPQLADTRIDYAWGGTLAITLNRLPHIGRLEPTIFFAQGYSGHGVGMATLAGKIIAEAVAGSAERFDVFARIPTRTFPGGRYLRWPGLVLGMLYYALRDRL